jgi:hypothetical protein
VNTTTEFTLEEKIDAIFKKVQEKEETAAVQLKKYQAQPAYEWQFCEKEAFDTEEEAIEWVKSRGWSEAVIALSTAHVTSKVTEVEVVR